MIRSIIFVTLVLKYRLLTQNRKSMRKPLRQEKLQFILFTQLLFYTLLYIYLMYIQYEWHCCLHWFFLLDVANHHKWLVEVTQCES